MIGLSPRGIRLGFYAAAAVNVLGVLVVSQAYGNGLLNSLSPSVFSNFGLCCIQLWGLAYFAVADRACELPGICWVFALEKLAYTLTWLNWLSLHHTELPAIAQQSAVTASFFAGYGLIDLAFGLFFAWVGLRGRRLRASW